MPFGELHVAEIQGIVENGKGIAHEILEAFDIRVEAHEDASTVVVHSRHRLKTQRVPVKGVAVCILARNALEFTAGIVNPAVIKTPENLRAATLVIPAHQVATVAAGVQQRADPAIVTVDQDQRSPRYGPGDEVTRFREFGDVAGKKPGAVEYPASLQFKDFLVDKRAAMYSENALFAVIQDETCNVACFEHFIVS